MGVAAAERVEVEVEPAVVGQRPEEVLEQLRGHGAQLAGLERDAVMKIGPAREVDHAARERLVQRHVGVSEARDARLVAQRLQERLADHDADVLDGVVGIHVQVALRAHVEVEAAVGGEGGEHVVQEADAGLDRAAALSVEVESHAHLRLTRLALHHRAAQASGQAA